MRINDDFFEVETIYNGSNNREEIDTQTVYKVDANSASKKVVELCCTISILMSFDTVSVFVVYHFQAGVKMKNQRAQNSVR